MKHKSPRRQRLRAGECLKRGYDLRGSPGAARPECGEPLTPTQVKTKKVQRHHRH